MERSEVRAYMNRYRRMQERQRQIRDRLARIEDSATSITAELNGMPRPKGRSDKVGKGAADAADFRRELEELRRESLEAVQEIFHVIDMVQDADRAEVLDRHYIMGQSIIEIADVMHFSDRWIAELHGRALDDVGRIIEARIKTNA